MVSWCRWESLALPVPFAPGMLQCWLQGTRWDAHFLCRHMPRLHPSGMRKDGGMRLGSTGDPLQVRSSTCQVEGTNCSDGNSCGKCCALSHCCSIRREEPQGDQLWHRACPVRIWDGLCRIPGAAAGKHLCCRKPPCGAARIPRGLVSPAPLWGRTRQHLPRGSLGCLLPQQAVGSWRETWRVLGEIQPAPCKGLPAQTAAGASKEEEKLSFPSLGSR